MDEEKEYLRDIILTNELGNMMLDTVAPIYDQSKLALYVFQANGIVLSKETQFVNDDFILQIFPQTATWGLKYWEEEYGITTDESKTIDERRAYLMSVMFKKLPMTPYRVKQIVKGVTGCNCKVDDNTYQNSILIIIQGYVPGKITLLKNELDKKLPAHISYTIRMSENYEMETSTYTGAGVSVLEHYEIQEV